MFNTATFGPSDGHFAAVVLNGGSYPRVSEYMISDKTTSWTHRGLTVCASVYLVDGGRSRGFAAMTTYAGWQFSVDSSGVLQLQRTGLDLVASGSASLTTYRKYRVGVTHQIGTESNNITFYIDGKPDATATSTKTYGTTQSAVIAGAGGYTGIYLNGWISNIATYGRHLSSHEMAWEAEWAERQYCGEDSPLNRITGRTYFLPPYTATTRKTGYAPWIPGLGW